MMLPSGRLSVCFAATAILLTSMSAHTQEAPSTPLPSHLPLRVEACFGRTYDAAHLAQHAKQRVTSLYLFRDFTPDPTTEIAPVTREELLEQDGNDGNVSVTAYVRLRDRKGVFWNSLSCRRYEGSVRCGIDCDGGGFRLRPAGEALTLDNEGFVVVGGCGAGEDEQERPVFIEPGADDKTFRLERRPIAECTALRDAERPAWAKLGIPLRVRFDRDDTVCFARQYDAAHLASHPQQKVRRIAMLKPQGMRPGTDEAPTYALRLRVELTDGRRIEKKATCSPDRYSYGCTVDEQSDTDVSFSLTRADNQHMMLRDAKDRLGMVLGATLGTDDRLFKLQSAPASACTF